MTEQAADLEANKQEALALAPVSRGTLSALETYVALLLEWNTRVNLIAASTVPQIWTRHIADSLQLLRWAGDMSRWLDLGSGAGVPGVVLACALRERPGTRVDLVESTLKKARFLEHVVLATGAPAVVHAIRVEQLPKDLRMPQIVTARGLAPLPRLLELAAPFLRAGARGLFPKGKSAEAELTAARESWKLDVEIHPSITDSGGRILEIRHAQRR